MMSGVQLETCWTFNKLWNNKFHYKAASCWYFYWVIYDARIHEYQIRTPLSNLEHQKQNGTTAAQWTQRFTVLKKTFLSMFINTGICWVADRKIGAFTFIVTKFTADKPTSVFTFLNQKWNVIAAFTNINFAASVNTNYFVVCFMNKRYIVVLESWYK
jgi:hypothetical protein